MADFLTEFHIINEADDRLSDIQDECTDSQQEFIMDIRHAIVCFVSRERGIPTIDSYADLPATFGSVHVYSCDEDGCQAKIVGHEMMLASGWCEVEPSSQDVHFCPEHHPMNYMESKEVNVVPVCACGKDFADHGTVDEEGHLPFIGRHGREEVRD